jgi:hypothetical protein
VHHRVNTRHLCYPLNIPLSASSMHVFQTSIFRKSSNMEPTIVIELNILRKSSLRNPLHISCTNHWNDVRSRNLFTVDRTASFRGPWGYLYSAKTYEILCDSSGSNPMRLARLASHAFGPAKILRDWSGSGIDIGYRAILQPSDPSSFFLLPTRLCAYLNSRNSHTGFLCTRV